MNTILELDPVNELAVAEAGGSTPTWTGPRPRTG